MWEFYKYFTLLLLDMMASCQRLVRQHQQYYTWRIVCAESHNRIRTSLSHFFISELWLQHSSVCFGCVNSKAWFHYLFQSLLIGKKTIFIWLMGFQTQFQVDSLNVYPKNIFFGNGWELKLIFPWLWDLSKGNFLANWSEIHLNF